jgi:DNA-binding Xre family transcriptional regulator
MPINWNLKNWLKSERGIKGPAEARRCILNATGFDISVKALTELFNKKPEILPVQTLQALCDTFTCRLSAFCSIDPNETRSSEPRGLELPLPAFSIESTETLRAFIARVQLAAIDQTAIIEGTMANAAQRLHYSRTSLTTLRTRLESSKHENNQAVNLPPESRSIPLPPDLFVIKKAEGLQAFITRLQLEIITKTINLEGNKTRAAARLGYSRAPFLTLIKKLTTATKTLQVKAKL